MRKYHYSRRQEKIFRSAVKAGLKHVWEASKPVIPLVLTAAAGKFFVVHFIANLLP